MKQVTRSLLTLAALGTVSAGVAGYAWLRAGEVDPAAAPDDKRVFDLPASRFDRVEIAVEGNVVRLEAEEGRWLVTRPARILADASIVRELLGQAVRLRAEERLGRPGDPEVPEDALSGLDERAAVFTAWREGEAGTRIEVALGRQSPFNRRLYARAVQGEHAPEVIMVSATARSQLIRPASQLYDRRVLGAAPDRVRRLTVEPKAPSPQRIVFTLERLPSPEERAPFPQTRYRVTEPDLGEADAFQAGEVLRALSAMPVSSFVTLEHDGALERFGLAAPEFIVSATLALVGSGGEEQLVERKLRVSDVQVPADGSSPFVYVAREDQPWVGEVNARLLEALPQTEDRLKNKRLIDIEQAKVWRIEMRLRELGLVTLERTGAVGSAAPGWRLLAPEPGPAKVYLVNRHLLTFTRLIGLSREAEGDAARDPAVLKRTGLDDASAQTIAFFGEGGAPLGALRLGATDGEHLFAMAEGGEFIVRVPKAKLREVPRAVADLLE